jgi:hypothetical protein
VETLRRFLIQGEDFASIHLRQLDNVPIQGKWLGLVRGDMPFALILLDGIEQHTEKTLRAIIEDGTCSTRSANPSANAYDIDAKCGSTLLNQLRKMNLDVDKDVDLVRQALLLRNILITERHELQHLVDGDGLENPLALYELIPAATDDQINLAMRELSAQSCELATDDELEVILVLAHLQSFLLTVDPQTQRAYQTPYLYGAGLIAEELTQRNIIDTYGALEIEPLLGLWDSISTTSAPDGNALGFWAKTHAARIHDIFANGPCPKAELMREQRAPRSQSTEKSRSGLGG